MSIFQNCHFAFHYFCAPRPVARTPRARPCTPQMGRGPADLAGPLHFCTPFARFNADCARLAPLSFPAPCAILSARAAPTLLSPAVTASRGPVVSALINSEKPRSRSAVRLSGFFMFCLSAPPAAVSPPPGHKKRASISSTPVSGQDM